jgi:hypothetical protein
LNGEPAKWWSAPGVWFTILTVVVSALATATFFWAQFMEPEVFHLHGQVTSLGISGLEFAPPSVPSSADANAGRHTHLVFRPELLKHVTSLTSGEKRHWEGQDGNRLSMLALTRPLPTRPFCDQIQLSAVAGRVEVGMAGRTAASNGEKCALGLTWSGGGSTDLVEGEVLVLALDGNESTGTPVFAAPRAGGLDIYFESAPAESPQWPFPGKHVRMTAQWVQIESVDLLPGSPAFDVSASAGNPDEVAAVVGTTEMAIRRRPLGARPLNIVSTVAAALTLVFSLIKMKREICGSGSRVRRRARPRPTST